MISAMIITLNEEKNLERALQSIKNLVNEIIVVDSGSIDETLKIAEKFGARVFLRKFDNFANQKNWALEKTSSKWILSLDADEEIPNELAQEIKQAIKNDQIAGYRFGRKNIILGKEIKYSRWSPDKHIWLWQKALGKWVGKVHEEVIVKGEIGELKGKKIHHSHGSIKEFIDANNFYSSLLAESLYKKGIKFSFVKMFWGALYEFNIRFFVKRGFLDGWRGLCLAYLMAIYQLMAAIKLWELERKQ